MSESSLNCGEPINEHLVTRKINGNTGMEQCMDGITSFGTLGVGGINSRAMYFFCSYFALTNASRAVISS